jgi:hypothetical protein
MAKGKGKAATFYGGQGYVGVPRGMVGAVQGQRPNGTLYPTVHWLAGKLATPCGMRLGAATPTPACKRLGVNVVASSGTPTACGRCAQAARANNG